MTLNTNCCDPQHKDQKHRFTNAFTAMWMDVEIIILSEVSQRERQISYGITYIWTQKNSTNKLIYKTKTDSQTENKLTATKGEARKG